jgi:hypothetical protein
MPDESDNAIQIAKLDERSQAQNTALKSMEDRINSIEKKVDAGFSEIRETLARVKADIRWSLGIAGGLGAAAYAVLELLALFWKK